MKKKEEGKGKKGNLATREGKGKKGGAGFCTLTAPRENKEKGRRGEERGLYCEGGGERGNLGSPS